MPRSPSFSLLFASRDISECTFIICEMSRTLAPQRLSSGLKTQFREPCSVHKLLSPMHILKGTPMFYLAPPLVTLLFCRLASGSFSEQPSYPFHLALCPAPLSASQWELSPPQAGASGPMAKGPINQRLCPRHAKHLHRPIAFLTKKAKWPSHVWSRASTPSSVTAPFLWQWPQGEVQVCPCDRWVQRSRFQSWLLSLKNHLGSF